MNVLTLFSYRSLEQSTEDQPPDPISAGAASLIMDLSAVGLGIADIPRGIFKKSQSKEKKPKKADAKSENDEAKKEVDTKSTTDLSSVLSSSDSLADSTVSEQTIQGTASTRDVSDVSSMISKEASTSEDQTQASKSEAGQTPVESQTQATETQTKQSSTPGRATKSTGVDVESVLGTGKSVSQIVGTGVRSPMNFCLGLAKGFRNLPRLYNDDTIRPVEKVTGLPSGIRVASKELGLGFYDGITGLVTQPMRGAEKEGAAGLIKGFGKGIGGLVAKSGAGEYPRYCVESS